MEEIIKRIEEYRVKAEILIKKELEDYPTLRDMENEFCETINEGNAIRRLLLTNPEKLDRRSYLFLSNQVMDSRILADEYQPLTLVMFLSKKLYEAYVKYAKILEGKQEYEELINIYSACFNLSRLNSHKKQIADILYDKFNNANQAIEIYEEIKDSFNSDYSFFEKLSQMYGAVGDGENSEKYHALTEETKIVTNAKALINEKNYEKAIEMYDGLYASTGKSTYKMEIANIYAVCCENIPKAIEIYKELENVFSNDKDYWYKLSELYEHIENYYRQVLCMQKAIYIELNINSEEEI